MPALPYSIYAKSDFWLNSPAQILTKLGVILMVLPFAFLWTRYGASDGWSWSRQFGTTSLLVYWVHIELVYGRWLYFWKENLDVAQTVNRRRRGDPVDAGSFLAADQRRPLASVEFLVVSFRAKEGARRLGRFLTRVWAIVFELAAFIHPAGWHRVLNPCKAHEAASRTGIQLTGRPAQWRTESSVGAGLPSLRLLRTSHSLA